MSQKMLEKGSVLAEKLDANGDGIVTDKDIWFGFQPLQSQHT